MQVRKRHANFGLVSATRALQIVEVISNFFKENPNAGCFVHSTTISAAALKVSSSPFPFSYLSFASMSNRKPLISTLSSSFRFARSNSSVRQAVGVSFSKTPVPNPVFLLNVDPEVPSKITYVNYIPKAQLGRIDGKTWAGPVGELLGGKGGGKPESFQGVGSQVGKVEEAKKVAEETFASKTSA
jgi:hypothetical protein